MIENTCFHVWHTEAREAAWGGARSGYLPKLKHVRFEGSSQIDSSAVENESRVVVVETGGSDVDGGETVNGGEPDDGEEAATNEEAGTPTMQ